MLFDPDTDEDVYQDQHDVTCPKCDHTQELVRDALGFYTRRRPHQIEWSFWCYECNHKWTETEDLRSEP